MHAPIDPAVRLARANRIIPWLAVAAFASSASIRVADALLPPIAAEFGTTAGVAAGIATAYSIAYGMLQLVYGPLGDRVGKVRVIIAASLAAALATLACAAAPSLAALTGLRFVAGGLAAAIIPLSLAFIGDNIVYERRQAVIARFLLGISLGLIFGQAVGGILSEHIGWRAVFVAVAGLLLAAALGIWRIAGVRRFTPPPPPEALRTAYLKALALLALRRVRRIVLITFLEAMLVIGAFTFVGAHLHDRFRLGYDEIGVVLAFYGAGGILYALAAPVLIRWLGERGLVGAGGALLAAAFAGLAASPSWIPVAPLAFVVGLAFLMVHNTLQTRATQMAPDTRGAAVSLFACCFFMGQTTGVALGGLGYDAFGARPGFAAAALGMPILALALRRFLRQAA